MYRWARNEEFRNHAKYTEEPKKLEEHIQNGYKNIIDDANTNNNCNENNAEVDSERSNNERISKDSGLSNGIDSTDSSSNSRKSIFMDQIDCDNNDKVDIIRCEEKSTQTDLLDLNGSEISSIPPTRIPIAPPFPEHFLVPASSSTPIKSDRNTKAVHAFNATPPAPPPPPPPPPAPLVKTTSRTILSSASSFCAPDQNKSIPGPPPMPCPPPMPQITGSGKDSKSLKTGICDQFSANVINFFIFICFWFNSSAKKSKKSTRTNDPLVLEAYHCTGNRTKNVLGQHR